MNNSNFIFAHMLVPSYVELTGSPLHPGYLSSVGRS